MTKINASNWNNYDSRKAVIQVTGLSGQNDRRRSNYTIVVTYNRLSQTIQQLGRTGGKIVNITVSSSALINIEGLANSQALTTAVIDESKSATTSEAQPIKYEKLAIQESIKTETSQEDGNLQPPIVTPQKVDLEKTIARFRRKRTQSDRTTFSKRYSRNSIRIRDKKARKRSKTYLVN